MKTLLITITAVVLMGCAESQKSTPAPKEKAIEPSAEVPAQQLAPAPEAKPVDPIAETILQESKQFTKTKNKQRIANSS